MSAEKDVEINHETLNAPAQLIWCFLGSLVVPDLLSSDSVWEASRLPRTTSKPLPPHCPA